MQIAIAIVNFRTPDLVISCLESVKAERSALPGLKAVVVDNLSGDNSVERLTSAHADPAFADWVDFLPLPLNGGFGWGNNQAILHLLKGETPPDAILLLNPDTRIEPGAIAALAHDMAARPDAGAIGSQLLNEDGSLSGSAFRFPSIGREFVRGCGISAVGRLLGIAPTLVPYGERGPVDWVTGASVMLRTEALRQAGLFDTGFFLYFEEVELMHRLGRHGWRCYHCPESRVMHVAGAATGVVDGQSKAAAAPPDYLFASRRRYFALAGGTANALLADLAWLAGTAVASLAGMTGGRPRIAPSAERQALLRLGLGAKRTDALAHVTTTDQPPGMAPAWMG